MAFPVEIVLASGNRGKQREFAELLAGRGCRLRPQSEWDFAEAEETGLTFVENAIIKARHAAGFTGLPALADDSGLCVDALGGRPGIRSARYAGDDAADGANLAKLLAALEGCSDDARGARFVCALVLMRTAEDPAPLVCQGEWRGLITRSPRGAGGFGYDPVFLVGDRDRTAAELEPAVKNRISHRGQALARLLAELDRAYGAGPAAVS